MILHQIKSWGWDGGSFVRIRKKKRIQIHNLCAYMYLFQVHPHIFYG